MRGVTLLQRSVIPAFPAGLPRIERTTLARPPERKLVTSYVMTMLSLCLLVMILNVTLVTQLQHYTAQNRLYDEFRQTLAEGSIPIGQTDLNDELVRPGTPVAELVIPALGVDEVVVEGTTSSETAMGVGHRPDTPLPGQPGVSVLMGRKAAFGGVFKNLDQLATGQEFSVITGQGISRYRVLGVRTDGTMLPVLGPEDGRLTLITASGPAFRPTGAVRVDAELVTESFGVPTRVLGPGAISESEEVLKGDTSRAFALSWLLLLLALLVVAALWSWQRWQRLATWIVFAPVLLVVGLTVAGSLTLMLPNLL